MIVELHMIQSFAPSNLNRDDTGAPKDCDFGGYRRARISSQALKRAIRTEMKEGGLLPADALGERTKLVVDAVADRVIKRDPEKSRDQVTTAITNLLAAAKLTIGPDQKTQYLLFLGQKELDKLAELTLAHWNELSGSATPSDDGSAGRRNTKAAAKSALKPEIVKAVVAALDGGKAADLALFGRMVADLPQRNVEASSQVAHAISTHKVDLDFDFFSAVDDLQSTESEAGAGAGMLGIVQFNSACFYRYSNLDTRQLLSNLDGDGKLQRKAIEAFIEASVRAIPTGKQNSMAAHNPPSLIMAVVRERGAWSLANAFVEPVDPRRDGGLVQESVKRLDQYWNQLTSMYGNRGITGVWVVTTEGDSLKTLQGNAVGSLDDLVHAVVSAAAETTPAAVS